MADLKTAWSTAKNAFLLRSGKPLVPALNWTPAETWVNDSDLFYTVLNKRYTERR